MIQFDQREHRRAQALAKLEEAITSGCDAIQLLRGDDAKRVGESVGAAVDALVAAVKELKCDRG